MKYLLVYFMLLTGCANHQQQIKIDLYLTEIADTKIGTVWFKDTANGMLVEVKFKGLPQGYHGFHIHENPDCSSLTDDKGNVEYAGKAGDYYNPYKTGKHLGSNGGSHLGNLPYLTVDDKGRVDRKFYIKKVKVEDFKNRSIMIHLGSDNYNDTPFPLGGGKRIACGIIL